MGFQLNVTAKKCFVSTADNNHYNSPFKLSLETCRRASVEEAKTHLACWVAPCWRSSTLLEKQHRNWMRTAELACMKSHFVQMVVRVYVEIFSWKNSAVWKIYMYIRESFPIFCCHSVVSFISKSVHNRCKMWSENEMVNVYGNIDGLSKSTIRLHSNLRALALYTS